MVRRIICLRAVGTREACCASANAEKAEVFDQVAADLQANGKRING
jgi:hypothetical protein